MATTTTTTLTQTIEAPVDVVSADLSDASSHPEWATEFFAGPATPTDDGDVLVDVPRMGGPARMRVEADVPRGIVDIYLAPEGAPFGPPLPVRVVPNGDGADVLWTLGRPPGVDDTEWEHGVSSMQRELEHLRARLEDR